MEQGKDGAEPNVFRDSNGNVSRDCTASRADVYSETTGSGNSAWGGSGGALDEQTYRYITAGVGNVYTGIGPTLGRCPMPWLTLAGFAVCFGLVGLGMMRMGS